MDFGEKEKLVEALANRVASKQQLEQDAQNLAKDAQILAEDMAHFASELKVSADVPTDPLIGMVVDQKYEVVELLGAGGMGTVYKARNKVIGKVVALKVLHRKYAVDAQSRMRFQQEAKAASALSHPNLVTVWDFGFLPTGEPFIAMDFVDGESLSKVIERGAVDWHRALPVFSQIADGLAHAHARGIIHRDLKPSNVVLTKTEKGGERVTILDFGIAKIIDGQSKEQQITQTGEVFGSPPYMSPEQCMGNQLDARSDIYSFGCLMYEALAGEPAFLGENPMQTIFMHVNEEAPAIDDRFAVPELLREVVARALARQPEQRFPTCVELSHALDAVGSPGAGALAGKLRPAGKKKNSVLLAVLGGTLLVACLCLSVVWLNGRPVISPPGDHGAAKMQPPTVTRESQNRLFNEGLELEHKGHEREALAVFSRALERESQFAGKRTPEYVMFLTQIGYCQSQLGEKEDAIKSGQQAVDIAHASLNPHDVNLEWALCMQASNLARDKRYADADKMYAQDVQLASDIGLRQADVANRYGRWAQTYGWRHDFVKAAQMYGRAVGICQNSPDEKATITACLYQTAQGQMYAKLGKADEARALFAESFGQLPTASPSDAVTRNLWQQALLNMEHYFADHDAARLKQLQAIKQRHPR